MIHGSQGILGFVWMSNQLRMTFHIHRKTLGTLFEGVGCMNSFPSCRFETWPIKGNIAGVYRLRRVMMMRYL